MTNADAIASLIVALIAIIGGLVSYIFITFRKDTQSRFSHLEKLTEQMAENNAKLNELFNSHEYRLRNVEAKLQINHIQP